MFSWANFTRPHLRETLGAFIAATLVSSLGVTQAQKFSDIGRPATAAEIKAWDIDVRSDFKGLPKGKGSVATGQHVWEAKCESCHGVFGESNEVFTPIVGGTTKDDIRSGRVANLRNENYPQRTTLMKLSELATLWDYINRAMPWNAPKTLTTEEVYAVTAYILHLGDIVPADFVLSHENVAQVQNLLPNRNGKTREHGLWELGGKPDVQGSACMSNCKAEARVVSTLPDYARNAHGQLADQKRIIGGVRGIDSLRPAPKSFVASAARQAPTATPSAATAASEGLRLAQQHACLACHGIGNKLVGPALIDIHKKYAAQKVDAARVLAVRIKAGGSGVWGAVPMPAQDHVPDAEIRAMAEWIAKGEFK